MTRAPDLAGSAEATRPLPSRAAPSPSGAVAFDKVIDATCRDDDPEPRADPETGAEPLAATPPEPAAATAQAHTLSAAPEVLYRPCLMASETTSAGARRPTALDAPTPAVPPTDAPPADAHGLETTARTAGPARLAEPSPLLDGTTPAGKPLPPATPVPGTPSSMGARPSEPAANDAPHPPIPDESPPAAALDDAEAPDDNARHDPPSLCAARATDGHAPPTDAMPPTAMTAPGPGVVSATSTRIEAVPVPGGDSPAPGPALTPEAIDRVGAALLRAARIGTTETRVEVDLEPAQLGRVHLEIVIEGQQIRVSGWAVEADAAHALANQLPELRAALQGKGVLLADFAVVWSGARAGVETSSKRPRAAGVPGAGFGIFREERRRRRVDVIA